MRHPSAAAASLVCALSVTGLLGWFATGTARADNEQRYRWRNVEIVGGGYVPGIVFNQSEPDLVYARTDIGGAYRWDPHTNRWKPLLDWVSASSPTCRKPATSDSVWQGARRIIPRCTQAQKLMAFAEFSARTMPDNTGFASTTISSMQSRVQR